MKRLSKTDNNWMSFSDLMTGLMVIFLFISINFILDVVSQTFVAKEVYNKLDLEFTDKLEEWGAELEPDGTLRFTPTNHKNLFESGSEEISSTFKNTLNEFIPKYLEIITDSTYLGFVSEIRIEGHTDQVGHKRDTLGWDSYRYNLDLSSKRAQNVLQFIRETNAFKELHSETQKRLEFLFTANGLSYSRALNNNGKIAYVDTLKKINSQMSRRVEFKIVSTNHKLMNDLTNANQ